MSWDRLCGEIMPSEYSRGDLISTGAHNRASQQPQFYRCLRDKRQKDLDISSQLGPVTLGRSQQEGSKNPGVSVPLGLEDTEVAGRV